MLIAAYALGMFFSLKTHREFFGSESHGDAGEEPWPMAMALATLAGVTVLVALVSEIFVESVQQAAVSFGMTQAFVGFIVVALVGAAAEMASAFSGACKNRLDLSVGIALGSASQIALFVAPVLVLLSYVMGPTPMDLQFWPGAVVMMLIATLTASLVTNSGRSAWFVGVLVLMVYLIFAKDAPNHPAPKKLAEYAETIGMALLRKGITDINTEDSALVDQAADVIGQQVGLAGQVWESGQPLWVDEKILVCTWGSDVVAYARQQGRPVIGLRGVDDMNGASALAGIEFGDRFAFAVA